MNHTPEPWGIADRFGACNVSASGGRSICSTGGYQNNSLDSGDVRIENEANAARIVSCVNALSGLNPEGVRAVVEAARKLSFAAQTTGGTAGRDDGLVAAIDAMEAALAKVRAQP